MKEPGGRSMARKRQPKRDIIYTNVVKIINKQRRKSKQRFTVTMQDRDKPLTKWIEDTQEELIDAVLYLEKVKYDLVHKSNKTKHRNTNNQDL